MLSVHASAHPTCALIGSGFWGNLCTSCWGNLGELMVHGHVRRYADIEAMSGSGGVTPRHQHCMVHPHVPVSGCDASLGCLLNVLLLVLLCLQLTMRSLRAQMLCLSPS